MRTRKNVKSLTETEKKNFVTAVLALKKKPSTLHPGNTGFGRYDDYVEVYRNATLNQIGWAHGGPALLPWHREFILQCENDLAVIDASVALPYWNWTDSNPGGQIPISPGDPWTRLSPAARDTLIGLAVNELAAQIANTGARHQVQAAVAALTSSARAASS